MTEAGTGLGRRMARGAAWTVSARIAVRLAGIASMVVLARLLVPADFGLVGLASMLVGLLSVLSALGFDVVLIQNQQAGRAHYDTVWTLTVIRNAAMALAIVALAGAGAAFFEEPRLEGVLYWLALSTLIAGFANVAVVDFRKELTFHKDFVLMLAPKLGMILVTLPLAFLWRDYRALVAGTVAGAVISLVLGYALKPYRPRPTLARWREIMDFSKWLVLNSVVGFLYRSSDGFMIGKLVGTQALGLYSVAQEIAGLASAELLAPIRRALLPGYAKMAAQESGEPETLARGFVAVFGLALMLGAPVAAGIGLVAEPLVRLGLGETWLGAIPLVRVLALHGLLSVLAAGSGPVFLALGKPQLRTLVSAVGLVCLAPLLLWGVLQAGALGAAWAVVGARAVTVALDLLLAVRLLDLPPASLARAAWRPLLGVAVMALVVLQVQGHWPAPSDLPEVAAALGAAVAAGALTYLGLQLAFWRLTGLNPLSQAGGA